MAVSRVHVWVANEVLTASDLNAEFSNITSGGIALISPSTGNLSMGAFRVTNLGSGTVSAPALGFDDSGSTGVYSPQTGAVALTAAGTQMLIATAGYVSFPQAMRLPVSSSTRSADVNGLIYLQSTEGCVHVSGGTIMLRTPALGSIQAGDLIIASNPNQISGATTFARLPIGTPYSTPTVIREGTAYEFIDRRFGSTFSTTTVSNSALETTIWQMTVPGGLLGTLREIHVDLYNSLARTGTPTITVKLKYGGSTLCTLTGYTTNASAAHPHMLRAKLVALNSKTSQLGYLEIVGNDAGDGFGAITGTAAIDSDVAQTLAVTFQWSAGDPANVYSMQRALTDVRP